MSVENDESKAEHAYNLARIAAVQFKEALAEPRYSPTELTHFAINAGEALRLGGTAAFLEVFLDRLCRVLTVREMLTAILARQEQPPTALANCQA